MGWEAAAIGAAGVLAAAGLVYALVRAYGRSRQRTGAAEALGEAMEEGAKRHAEVDEILAQPAPVGDDLRARMRLRLQRLRGRLGR